MLVLARKVNEVIRIDPDIKITVIQVAPHHVRLGIEAPADIRIIREELLKDNAPFTHIVQQKREQRASAAE